MTFSDFPEKNVVVVCGFYAFKLFEEERVKLNHAKEVVTSQAIFSRVNFETLS